MNTGSDKKKVWINEEKKIISFHPIPGTTVYAAPEKDFWDLVLILLGRGFLVT